MIYTPYKANSLYKTKEFQEQHKYALFKLLITYHRIFYHEQNSVLSICDSVKLRTNQYLENSCDLVAWFQFEYTQDDPNEVEVSYLSISDLHKNFLESDVYRGLSKKEQSKYIKVKFFDFIRNNIFFKKYYVERFNNKRHHLKGWFKIENIDI